MATEKRAGTGEDKKYGRRWVKWVPVIIALCVGGAAMWYASGSGDHNARLDALIEGHKKMTAELEELGALIERSKKKTAELEELKAEVGVLEAKVQETTTELKELQEQIARDSRSP